MFNLNREDIKVYIINIILFLALFIALFPLLYLLHTAFKPTEIITSLPPSFIYEPSLENFELIYERGILQNAKNSMIYASFSTIIALLVGVPAAYSLSRLKPKGHEVFSILILGLRFIPFVAVTFPLFVIFANYGLVGSRPGVILAYQIITLPLVIWLTKGFFDQIPISADEAAKIDGCNDIQVFLYINLPRTIGPIIAVTLIVLIATWNDLFIANILTRGVTEPLTVGIQQFLEGEFQAAQFGALSAWGAITTLPIVITALIFNKYIIQAWTSGA